MWHWLENARCDLRGIVSIEIFGSVLSRNIDPQDVDVIIVTRKIQMRQEILNIKNRFKRRFRKNLDIQIFFKSQVGSIVKFRVRCGPKKVIGNGKRSLLHDTDVF